VGEDHAKFLRTIFNTSIDVKHAAAAGTGLQRWDRHTEATGAKIDAAVITRATLTKCQRYSRHPDFVRNL
jgi:hypothetical protein